VSFECHCGHFVVAGYGLIAAPRTWAVVGILEARAGLAARRNGANGPEVAQAARKARMLSCLLSAVVLKGSSKNPPVQDEQRQTAKDAGTTS
jgi:hypothetical protein